MTFDKLKCGRHRHSLDEIQGWMKKHRPAKYDRKAFENSFAYCDMASISHNVGLFHFDYEMIQHPQQDYKLLNHKFLLNPILCCHVIMKLQTFIYSLI